MSTHDFAATTVDGGTQPLKDYAGQVLLVVNVASKCGMTPQYEGLEQLYRDKRDSGFQVLGFPCNQFGGQEPGTAEEIAEFCDVNYKISFPIFAKIDVNGDGADPLYNYLRSEAPGDFGPDAGFLYDHVKKTSPDAIGTDAVKWNFTKFLIGRDGSVIKRYEPTVTPEEISAEIDSLLS